MSVVDQLRAMFGPRPKPGHGHKPCGCAGAAQPGPGAVGFVGGDPSTAQVRGLPAFGQGALRLGADRSAVNTIGKGRAQRMDAGAGPAPRNVPTRREQRSAPPASTGTPRYPGRPPVGNLFD